MGTIRQPNATGIDKKIQGFQSVLYATLKNKWGLQDADWNCYDRAYRNQASTGYYPEIFVGGNTSGIKAQDYKEVFFEDTVKVQSFFGLGENISYKGSTATADVFLIVMVTNLAALKPGLLNRVDEAVRIDVQRACTIQRFGFFMSGTSLGIDNVFKEYSGWRKSDGIKNRDIYPFHCFRINFNVVYNILDC